MSAHSGSSASPWKFTGEQHEGAAGDTGYYFLRARYYDVDLGRFISRDPIEFDQRYAYANGNPVLYTDPSGLCVLGAPCPKPARWVGQQASRVGHGARDAVSCFTTPSCLDQSLSDVQGVVHGLAGARQDFCNEGWRAGSKIAKGLGAPVVYAACDLGTAPLGVYNAFAQTEATLLRCTLGTSGLLTNAGAYESRATWGETAECASRLALPAAGAAFFVDANVQGTLYVIIRD